MRLRAIAIMPVLVLGVSCGGDDASALGPGDYFAQLAPISENAHIQERGLGRELRVRLERAEPATRLGVVEVYVGQSVRLYQDVVDALANLEPVDGLDGPHDAYVGAWQTQLDLFLKVRDAGFDSAADYGDALDDPVFTEAEDETQARCNDLQAAVSAAGREVDLDCGSRPS